MSKIDQPRLANATPEYSASQIDQIIRTLEQIVLQLNSTFTQEAEERAEQQAFYFLTHNGD